MNAKHFAAACAILAMAVPAALAQDMGFVFPDPVFANITIDGEFGDWEGIEPAAVDPAGDGGAHFDFAAVYLANDNEYMYFRIEFTEPQPYGDFSWFVNTGFDMDLNGSTGFPWGGGTGAEFVVQGASIFDQRDCDWICIEGEASPENNWGAFAYADVAPFDLTTDVEFAVRRDLQYLNDADGLPGLTNPDGSLLFEAPFEEFIVIFETENEEYNSVEWVPDIDPASGEAGIFYSFAEGVPVPEWSVHE